MSDTEQIRAMITELYALVSGPGDKQRDWAREAELFMPQAHMIRTNVDAAGEPSPEIIRAADYAENFERKMAGRDFYEVEIHNVVEVFGNIAHAFSTYEAYEDAEGTRLLKRGINSIQFYRVDGEWKIAGMVWDDERPGLTIGPRYRPR
ncbi:MAG TPA: hypothetical protein VJ902_08765 [Wenzhouxiangellaceae bacterium]|nr:hypothetical protein [Wenzhouxiangellaceae bacterium]